MKLLLLSDLHLEFQPFEPPPCHWDAVVLAGDIGWPGDAAVRWAGRVFAGRPVLYVPGNHEYYDATADTMRRRMRDAARESGVQLLDRGTATIGPVRFLGCTLWTDFALRIAAVGATLPESTDRREAMARSARRVADYRCIGITPRTGSAPRTLVPADTLRWHRRERRWLAAELAQPHPGPTVVVSHHGPHRGSLAQRFAHDIVSTAFISELPETYFQTPSLWVHGHTHTSFDYRVGRCRIVCNPRGYPFAGGVPENPAFRPDCVVEV